MANITKTIQAELQGITAVASAAQSISSELSCPNQLAATIFIDFGLDSATTPVGTEFMIGVSQKASGNDTWRTIWSILTGVTAPSAIVTDAQETAGATVIECGATVPALNNIVFLKNSTIGNSEWVKVVARVITAGSESFTIQDGLTNIQAAGTYYDKAEQFIVQLDLPAIKRLRVVCNNNYAASSASCVWRCACITADSIG